MELDKKNKKWGEMSAAAITDGAIRVIIRLSPSVISNNQVSSILQIKFCAVSHSISYVFRVTEHIFWHISIV